MSRLSPLVLAALAATACKPTPYVPKDDTDTSVDTDTDTQTDTQTTPGDDDDDDGPLFDAHIVDELPNAAWATVGDLDGDGQPEIVVSSLGQVTGAELPPGLVSVYQRGADFDSWTRIDVVGAGDDVRFPGRPTLSDVDGDGDLDIILPSGGIACEPLPAVGPCGGLAWVDNPGTLGGAWTLRRVFRDATYFHEVVAVGDVDEDGVDDWVTVGERYTAQVQASELRLYRGLGGGQFDTNASVLATGAAPWPTLVDLDGDGDLDVTVGGRYAPMPAFAWVSHDGGPVWTPHTIDTSLGRGYLLRPVSDLYGDGEVRLVGTNHTNTQSPSDPDPQESVAVAFAIPGNPAGSWPPPDVLSTGIESAPEIPLFPNEAPGEFAAGDVDGDGDLDLVVAGDGDPTVYLLEQTSPGTFATRILRNAVGLSGGVQLSDLDGDGDLEIVCVSQLANGVYVIEYTGG
ncbi:MAG: VCBS repeat-containing protein [Myxococcota bacterium]